MSHSAIELIDVTFGYEAPRSVLNGITFSVPYSSTTVILGKSGSGKSTILKMVNGILKPDAGEVRLHGSVIDYKDIYNQRLAIGYVLQYVGLFPHMTIAENIGILGAVSRKSKVEIQSRIRELLDMVQLPSVYLTKYPHELSGGEQQRAGLCRALLLKPPILLMDEPFASLDGKNKQSIRNHLLEIQKVEPRTIVLVTHNLRDAYVLADRFVLVEAGQIISAGGQSDLGGLADSYFLDD